LRKEERKCLLLLLKKRGGKDAKIRKKKRRPPMFRRLRGGRRGGERGELFHQTSARGKGQDTGALNRAAEKEGEEGPDRYEEEKKKKNKKGGPNLSNVLRRKEEQTDAESKLKGEKKALQNSFPGKKKKGEIQTLNSAFL